ncbi:MAG: NIPSNAP family protein [Betaproteobacteria bacterium]|nr:NIPSNAP family protein [Betaproteobacteria bacterium]
MLYELRTYTSLPGRMPDLLRRFETMTLPMWEKHGIRQVGFWTTVIGPDNLVLYYMLQWASLADREQKWHTFLADPEWAAARAETERNGPLLSRVSNEILTPTTFSKLK